MLRRISNPDQNADNLLKLNTGHAGCCGEDATPCQYTATWTQTDTVSLLNITEDGVSVALLCVPATTSAADTQTAILAALVAAGYEDDGDATFDNVTVVDNGSTLTATIIGDVEAVSLTTSGGAVSFTAKCTRTSTCTFSYAAFLGGAGSILRVNGVNHSIGTATPGTTSAGTVKTALESALTAAGITGVATVTVNGSTSYTISITGAGCDDTLALIGAAGTTLYMTRSTPAPAFAA